MFPVKGGGGQKKGKFLQTSCMYCPLGMEIYRMKHKSLLLFVVFIIHSYSIFFLGECNTIVLGEMQNGLTMHQKAI